MGRKNWVADLTEGLGMLQQALAYRADAQRRARHDQYIAEDQRMQRERHDLALIDRASTAERQAEADKRYAEDQAMQRESHEWTRAEHEKRMGGDTIWQSLKEQFGTLGLDAAGKQAAAAALLQANNDPARAIEILRAQQGSLTAPIAPVSQDLDASLSAEQQKTYAEELKKHEERKGSLEGGITALQMLTQGKVLPQAAQAAGGLGPGIQGPPMPPGAGAGPGAIDPLSSRLVNLLRVLGQPLNMQQLRAMQTVGAQHAGVPVPGASAR